MAIKQLVKGEPDWQTIINDNFSQFAINANVGTMSHVDNFATPINGATCDGNGCYTVDLQNGYVMHVFDIVNLRVPASVVNKIPALKFPQGTFGAHVRFNVDQATNLDVDYKSSEGSVASLENFDNGLSNLCGEYVWFAKKEQGED